MEKHLEQLFANAGPPPLLQMKINISLSFDLDGSHCATILDNKPDWSEHSDPSSE